MRIYRSAGIKPGPDYISLMLQITYILFFVLYTAVFYDTISSYGLSGLAAARASELKAFTDETSLEYNETGSAVYEQGENM